MKTLVLLGAVVLIATPAGAAEGTPPPGRIASTEMTSSGQPIRPPFGRIQVTATIAEIGPDATTPVHKHPFPRFGYVLAGRLQVTNLETGKVVIYETGQFAVDPVGQWHQGHALDGKGVRLLVIDQTPPGQSNMVDRDPPPKPQAAPGAGQ